MMNPLFTIAIPAFKRRYLSEAIDSCLVQSYGNFEIVIVNDASPEDLDSVISKYDDVRIRYYRNKRNCGAINVVDNWNICLSYAKGDYIICMGDDDKLLPCCLGEYVKLMQKYPDLGVYHAWTELIDENSKFKTMQQPRPEYESAFSLAWNRWNGRKKQYIGDFCFDTKKLREDGGFYKLPLAWGADDITSVRAAVYGGIANTQILCFQYRESRFTITKTGNSKIKIDAVMKEKAWFLNFVSDNEKKANIDSNDKKYIMCIKHDLPLHYREKLKHEIYLDIKSHSYAFLKWLIKANNYGIKRSDVFISWLKSLK